MKTISSGKRLMIKKQHKNFKELAKHLLTPEIQIRYSNYYTSPKFRGSIRRVLGVKFSYPHTSEDKLQTRRTCGLHDPKYDDQQNEVLTEESMNMDAFWTVVPYSLLEDYQRFRGSCCLHHQP
jgi:hypothetical protein